MLLACAAAFGMRAAKAASVFAVTEPWVRVAPDGRSAEVAVDAEVRRRSPTDDHLLPHKHSQGGGADMLARADPCNAS